jgi:hypothetical protein
MSTGLPESGTGTLRRAVGCFFLFTGGVHLGMVAADVEVYRHFADGSLVPFVRDAWTDIFMAHAAVWALLVMTGELAMGVLLLRGGTAAKVGWVGVIAFHVALLLFGWGFWLWSVPVLAFLFWAARRDWPALGGAVPLRPAPAA